MTYFIHPTDSLSHEVYKEVKHLCDQNLFISPRGDYDHLNTPRLYGVYTNDEHFVNNYYRSGGLWDYMSLDQWCSSYEEQWS